MTNDLISADWYTSLVDDCKAIITEAVFNSRWELVIGYHRLGERIVNDRGFGEWHSKGNKSYLSDLSINSGINERDLYRAIQFYKKYPDIDMLPEGKNISWNKIVTNYLPSSGTAGTTKDYTASLSRLGSWKIVNDWDEDKKERWNALIEQMKEFFQ